MIVMAAAYNSDEQWKNALWIATGYSFMLRSSVTSKKAETFNRLHKNYQATLRVLLGARGDIPQNGRGFPR